MNRFWYSSRRLFGSADPAARRSASASRTRLNPIQLRSDYEDDPTKEGYDTFRDRRRLTNVFLGLAGAAAAGTAGSTRIPTPTTSSKPISVRILTGTFRKVFVGADLRPGVESGGGAELSDIAAPSEAIPPPR